MKALRNRHFHCQSVWNDEALARWATCIIDYQVVIIVEVKSYHLSKGHFDSAVVTLEDHALVCQDQLPVIDDFRAYVVLGVSVARS